MKQGCGRRPQTPRLV